MKRQTIWWLLQVLLVLAVLCSGQAKVPGYVEAAPPAIRLQQVNGPWVKLSMEPALSSAVGPTAQAAGARPLSLAAADLDADGTPEIVAGYVGDSGGLVVVYRQGAAQTFALPVAPDFLYAGDFDAQGGNDLIVAARGGDALWLLPGDATGNLGAPQAIPLPGQITALTAGELGRQDGLGDLAMGITGEDGAQLLILAGADDVQAASPERYPLPAPAIDLEMGQLDDAFPYDLAVVAGKTLVILHGGDDLAREKITSSLEMIPLDFEPISLALGDFLGGDGQTIEIALLDANGELRIANGEWRNANGQKRMANDGSRFTFATQLLPLRLSSLPADDLLVAGGRQAQILTADGRRMNVEGGYEQAVAPGALATLDAAAPVVAALSVRLNDDALDDLVLLTEGAPAPTVLLTAAALNLQITEWQSDRPDSNPGDGQCKTSKNTCTLRAAIQEANASPGADTIWSNWGNGVIFALNSPLPEITEAVTLIGSNVADAYPRIDGASLPSGTHGLRLTGNHITVHNFSVTNFTGNGIWITGSENVVYNCLIGTNYQGTSGLGNGQNGIAINGSYNEIRDNVIVDNTYAGIRVDGGNENKVLSGNAIGYWPGSGARRANHNDGVLVYGGANTRIGGDTPAQSNSIAGNTASGIRIEAAAGSVTVLANKIGAMANGQLLGNRHGIEVYSSYHTIGSTAQKSSWVAGNSWGIAILGPSATYNAVRYNLISTNTGLANSGDGIVLYYSGSNNVVENNTVGHSGQHGIAVYQYSAACMYNRIADNWVGTDEAGRDLGNGMDGIYVEKNYCAYLQSNRVAYNNRYGIYLNNYGADGSTLSTNQCHYNQEAGIRINSNGNTVSDNVVGLNPGVGLWVTGNANTLTSNSALGAMIPSANYQATGIQIDGNQNTLRGHNTYITEIAYHTGDGVVINGNENTVQRYYIHSNGDAGVEIAGRNNVIGAVGGNRNTIGVNNDGVRLTAAAGLNQVIGNYIGVETSGSGDAGNSTGVRIYGWGNQITANRIAYSYGSNVVLSGSDAHDNTLQDNHIGPTLTSHGVSLENASAGNVLQANQISSSGGAGIYIASGSLNRLISNTLTLNGGLGIDLAPTGVTLNDSGDGDSGANYLQNFPVLTAVTAFSSQTRIQGTLNSHPNTSFTIQFFLNTTCDASGYGEAETYLGQTTLTTNSSGQAGFDVTLAAGGAAGKYVVATATHTNGDTSELSKCMLGRAPTSGVPFTVNTTGDAVDTNIGDGVCDSSASPGEQCTLRAAVQETNFAIGSDTIILAAGTYALTLTGSDSTAAAGDLDINDPLTLIGAGANVTLIQGNMSDRILEIRNSAAVTITGMTVKGGNLTTSTNGGGILVNSGTMLTLEGVSVQENQTAAGSGGGLYSAGTLTLANSAIISNTAGGETNGGGGIFVLSGVTTLRNVTVSGNQANGNGGGIQNLAGTVNLNNVTITNNTADSDNDGGDGGGVWNTATFNTKNSIIAGNADLSAGGYPYGVADCSGTLSSQGYNLVGDQATPSSGSPACTLSGGSGDNTGGFWLFSNYLRYAAGLLPLALNGGTTLSHAPYSQAAGLTVDWGNPATPGSGGDACELFDQRGQPRPIDGGTDGVARCDRGAVELIPAYLSVDNVTVSEGSAAVFTFSLSEPALITFTVHYSTTDITAVAGQDYLHAAGILTFTPGQSSQTISVPTLTDTRNEDAETFRLRLDSVQWVLIADGEGIGTINDGNPQPALSINDRTVTEGDAGSSTQVVFTVSLNSASGKTVTVHYATADGTAIAGEDYLPAAGQLSFAPGVTSQTITVIVVGDNLREGNETWTVQLSNPVNATLGDATGLGTITDDDTPALSIQDSSIVEGDSGTAPMYFTVRLSRPSTAPITVNYITSPGTAQSGSDYIHTSGTVTFAAGEILKTITVQIVGDQANEPTEAFTVSLNTPTGGATIDRGVATGTIWEEIHTVYLPLVLRQ